MSKLSSKYSKEHDEGYEETEEILDNMNAEIESVYGQTYDDILEKAKKYLAIFIVADLARRSIFRNGEISKDEYKSQRRKEMFYVNRWNNVSDQIVRSLLNADEIAAKIINDNVPMVYAVNINWTAYTAERDTQIDTGFILYNEDTVKFLLRENPDLLPKAKVDILKDMRWSKQKINSTIEQGLLQGEDINQIANRLAAVSDMNRTSALRNAATMVTSAQNQGRLEEFRREISMGLYFKKMWIATLDFHTRESHRMLDGSAEEIEDEFSNGLMCPGDPNGAPEEVYNCRCTMIRKYEDMDFSKFDRHSRLGNMSYSQWKNSKGGEPQFKAARNVNRDMRMYEEYKTLIKGMSKISFSKFQEIKYNDPVRWQQMKTEARKEREKRRRK